VDENNHQRAGLRYYFEGEDDIEVAGDFKMLSEAVDEGSQSSRL
jgi:hypothetical protein